MRRWYDAEMKGVLTFLLILLLAAGGYAYFAGVVEAPGTPDDARIMSIESYIQQNISSLSPKPAVMGGTWYTTNVEADGGSGAVWYEDGHIALVADFEYIIDKYGITVTSFEVRE
jgi:hypothetical protein